MGLPRQGSEQDQSLLKELGKLCKQKPNNTAANEQGSGEQSIQNSENPYSALQAGLAKLAANYEVSL